MHASYRKSDDKDWDPSHWPSICSWDLVRELGTLHFVHRLSAPLCHKGGHARNAAVCMAALYLPAACPID